MTRIDFYILAATDSGARELFACRLVEKAYVQGHRVYIHVPDAHAAEQLDGLLWTFRAGSFLPHERIEAPDADAETPIHIGWGDDPGSHDDVLVNLCRDVPLFFSRFQRVAEVIAGEDPEREAGRQRFRFYRDRGYDLKTHHV